MALEIARRYAWYYINARTRYGIHSPFVYDLVTRVLEDTTDYPEYKRVEDLRMKLLANRQVLQVEDFGAGGDKVPVYERKVSEITARTAKPAKWGKLLFRLARYFGAANILELGTSMGISTAYTALGAKSETGALHFGTIEGSKQVAAMAAMNMRELGLDDVTVHPGEFTRVLPEVLAEFPSLDFVFIDGNHRKDPTLEYFTTILPRAHNDTLFVFDDIYWSEGMSQAWEEIKEMPEVTVTVDLFYMGLVFIRGEQAKEHFVVRF